MARQLGVLLVSLVLLSCFAKPSYGNVLFSSLKKSLIVTASPKQNDVLKAGEDTIKVTWAANKTAGSDSEFKTIKVKLCFAPISQKDRAWRKTKDDLSKDKTCQFKIAARPYSATNNSVEWTIERDVPQATYFVRAYALNAEGLQVAYGQSTNDKKTTNLFVIQPITGRHLSMDIASVCFSAFSVLSLVGFFIAEKRKAKSGK